MHNYRKAILFFAGAIAGVFAVLGVQSLANYDSIADLFADQSASAVARNYGLLAAGLIGLFVGSVRLTMASERQSQDKRSDLFDRFQKSSEMLDSKNIAVRQAGLYTLAEIAKEQPKEFYILVQSLFCGFLRHASNEQRALCQDFPKSKQDQPAIPRKWPTARADMQDAINLFTQLRKVVRQAVEIERAEKYGPDISGLFVPGYDWQSIDFSACKLDNCVLSDSTFTYANFKGCSIVNGYVDRAKFYSSRLESIWIDKTYVRWTWFDKVQISTNNEGEIRFEGSGGIDLQFSGKREQPMTDIHPVKLTPEPFPHFTDWKTWNEAHAKFTEIGRNPDLK